MVFWRQHLLLLQLLVISTLAGSLHMPVDDPASYQASEAAPFDGIPRPLIQNAPTTPNSKARLAATPFTQTSSNERCHRAIRRYSHNCQYIREHCAGYGDGIVNYVELYYCRYTTRHATVLAFMAAWLALLFVWLGVSASEYFSPNISTLSQLMHLPESLAGVTLLALGNGAPDLFSTFSAVRAGSGALALGQLIGSASFIVSVVIGATTLVVPVYKVSQLSYLRELCFFVATIGMVAVIVLSERLSRGLAICMMALYVAYVITVMATTYYEEQYVALEASVEGLDNIIALQADQPADFVCPEPSPRAVRPDSDSMLRPSQGQAIIDNTGQQRHRRHHRRQKTSCSTDIGLVSNLEQWSLDNPHGDGVSVRALGEFLHHHPKSLLAAAECSNIFDEMRMSQSHHVGPALEAYAPRPLQTAASSSAVKTSLCYDSTRLAPVEISGHSNWPNTGMTPGLSPIWPPQRPFKIGPHSSHQTNAGCTSGAGAELDLALTTDGEPRRAESGTDWYSFSQSPFAVSQSELLLPSSSKAALHLPLERRSQDICDRSVQTANAATATWAEGVVSNVRSVMSIVFLYSVLCLSDISPFATSRGARVSLGLALAVVSLLGNLVSRHAQQQRYWLQVAPCFIGFACGMAWVYIIANEVVSITQALGLMLGLSEEILGLTVVGFGNSLGDLVTNLALTRMGYPMMAISACFGGPMLCLLIGVGVAAYGIMAGSGPDNDDTYRMPITSPTVLVSTACLLLNSLIFLIAIPRQDYHMTRAVGLAALTVYFTGMAVNVYLEW
ncbi:hypothetical protein GGI01_000450 [Coemansia sp. RSA 376]|nr:hypothetical protein GGI01_000450 [Coemansia sp. RSA 376]